MVACHVAKVELRTQAQRLGWRGQQHPQTGSRVPRSGPASDKGFAAADLRFIGRKVPRPAQNRPQHPATGARSSPGSSDERHPGLPPTSSQVQPRVPAPRLLRTVGRGLCCPEAAHGERGQGRGQGQWRCSGKPGQGVGVSVLLEVWPGGCPGGRCCTRSQGTGQHPCGESSLHTPA